MTRTRRARACLIRGTLLLLSAVGLSGCSPGGYTLPAGHTHRGDVSRNVGNVALGRRAVVEGSIALRAGNIEVRAGADVRGAVTVINGNAVFGDSTRAASLDVANGLIALGRSAQVAGPVELTNGLVDINGARVEGTVTLVRGRLEVRSGSLLAGGVRVDNPGPTAGDSTIVVIRAGAAVRGTVAVNGRAQLVVEAGADTNGARFVGLVPVSHE